MIGEKLKKALCINTVKINIAANTPTFEKGKVYEYAENNAYGFDGMEMVINDAGRTAIFDATLFNL